MNHLDVTVTTLARAGKQLVLKTIRFNISIGKSPTIAGFSAIAEVQEGAVMYSRETEFHEMIARSTITPILLYAPDEGRGWLVP